MSPRLRRTLKALLALAGLLLLALASILYWLLGTSSGLHFALGQARKATHGDLHIQSASGKLAGPMQLEGVRYRNLQAGVDVKVGEIRLDVSVWSLLDARIRLQTLSVKDAEVDLTSIPGKPDQARTAFSTGMLRAPVDMQVDQARVQNVHIRRDRQPLFTLNRLDLAARWTSRGMQVRKLDLRAPQGRITLNGRLGLAPGLHGQARSQIHWTRDGKTWVGQLRSQSDGRLAKLQLDLSQPLKAELDLEVKQQTELPWTATLNVPRFHPGVLIHDSSLKALAVRLSGHGNRSQANLKGRIIINQLPLDLDPLQLVYQPEPGILHLRTLQLGTPGQTGRVQAHGQLDLAAQPLAARLTIDWKKLQLPASLTGLALASAGSLQVQGSQSHYQAQGQFTLGPPGKPARIQLQLDGNTRQLHLRQLALHQHGEGRLDIQGVLEFTPEIAWNATLNSRQFDPGQLFAAWPGAIDARLHTQGRLQARGPALQVAIDQLQGRLRQHPITGSGQLAWQPTGVVQGKLRIDSGDSRLSLLATGKQGNHLRADLSVPRISQWLPDVGGSLTTHATVSGLWPRLAARVHVNVERLQRDQDAIHTLTLDANLDQLLHPAGKLQLHASGLALGGLRWQDLKLSAQGNQDHHTLRMVVRGARLSLDFGLHGTRLARGWQGSIDTLSITPADQDRWSLAAPASVSWTPQQARLAQTCLRAGSPELCLSGSLTQQGDWQFSYRLKQLPLALLTRLAGEQVDLQGQGQLDGEGRLSGHPHGSIEGEARLDSQAGSLHYADRRAPPLLSWQDLHLSARLKPGQHLVQAHARFDHGGRLDGQLQWQSPQQALKGRLELLLTDLTPIQLFTREIANPKGRLDTRLDISGTFEQPVLAGQITLDAFAAELPALGLQLHDGHIQLKTADARQLEVHGQVGSGSGQLEIDGTLGLAKAAPSRIRLRGKQVQVAKLPSAQISISPDMTLSRDDKGLTIQGRLGIDRALVKLEQLPGAAAGTHSPDVVVVDAPQKSSSSASLAVRTDLLVDLGRHARLIGYGLNARAEGELEIEQQPGKPVTGRGQIALDGTFKAYGQDLDIQRGKLLFASTPIDNPGLAIRAIRRLNPNATINDGQEVGLDISGTARHPVITVFSRPAMDSSDALSYLITGKPLSQVKGGEGSMVNAAAQALGSAVGDLLAKGVGERLGVEAGVSSNTALGTTAFTVGKWLSPRLYLKYGVGLFSPGQVITLRYILSSRWSFEAQQATEFSRASFNYRLEH